MEVMGDTSDRNSFLNRDSDYCMNLIKNLKDHTDITVVYYDKELDRKLENERQAKRVELEAALETAPEKKIRGIKNDIEAIDNNTKSYNQRMADICR